MAKTVYYQPSFFQALLKIAVDRIKKIYTMLKAVDGIVDQQTGPVQQVLLCSIIGRQPPQ